MADNNNPRMAPADAVKDILFWGIVAFLTLGLLYGFETRSDTNTNSTILIPHYAAMAILVLAVMAMRAFSLFRPRRDTRKESPISAALTSGLTSLSNSKLFLAAALGFAIAFPFIMIAIVGPSGSLKWISNYGIMILIYIILGWGLNVVVGLAGLLDLGYVAFYAVGAYTYAILASHFGLSVWILVPLAGILAAFWGIILGFPVLRLRGDYLAIVTLAFGEIIHKVLINWKWFTGGNDGITALPRMTLFGIPFDGDNGVAAMLGLPTSRLLTGLVYPNIYVYYIVLLVAVLTAIVTTRLRSLPIGRAWEALREDEIACKSLGVDTTKTKLTAFAIGAMIGGFAGALFAARQGSISPESFVYQESVMVLAIVVLGGSGSLLGVVIAAILMQGGLNLLRELTFLKAVFGNDFDPSQYRFLIFGLALVIMMLWRPRGLISNRAPTAFLKERRVVSGDLVKEGHG